MRLYIENPSRGGGHQVEEAAKAADVPDQRFRLDFVPEGRSCGVSGLVVAKDDDGARMDPRPGWPAPAVNRLETEPMRKMAAGPSGGAVVGVGEPGEKAQGNLKDPGSPIMKTSAGGLRQCCSRQVVVEGGETRSAVGTAVAHNASGQGWLIPMVDPVAGACGETPEQVPADANYSGERELEERDIDGHPAPVGEGKAAAADPEPHPEKARMAETLASPEARRRHARRKWMAEAAAGWI